MTAGSVPVTIRWSEDATSIARTMGLDVTLPLREAWRTAWKAPLEGKVADTMESIDCDLVRLADYPFGSVVFDIMEGVSLTTTADRLAETLAFHYGLRDRGVPIRRGENGRLTLSVEPAAGPGVPDCAAIMMAAGLVPTSPLQPRRTALWEPPASAC